VGPLLRDRSLRDDRADPARAILHLDERGRAGRVYEETYHKHGFTPRQFKRLIEVGKWQRMPPGQRITEQGASASHVFYVHRGSSADDRSARWATSM